MTTIVENDAQILEKFSYKQEFKRTIRLFGSFAVAFSIISYMTVRGKQKFPEHHFNLGKLGYPVMIIALIWLFFGLGIRSVPRQFVGGTIVNISLCAAGIILYLAYFRKKVRGQG